MPNAFDFLILCGGQGTRLEGHDKPLLAYRGEAMVARVVATVPAGTRILISANRNLSVYRQWGETFADEDVLAAHPALEDGSALEHKGPLWGILGGLQRCTSEWLMVSPGDTPALSDDWFQPLLTHRNKVGAVIYDGERQQNLHLLLHHSLATRLSTFLATGEHRVWAWLDQIGVAQAVSSQTASFKNINTPTDLES